MTNTQADVERLREAGLEALDEARALIQEAKGFAGPGFITDHLDFAESWLDKIDPAILASIGVSEPSSGEGGKQGLSALCDALVKAQRADQTIVAYFHPDCSWDVFNAHTSADLLARLTNTVEGDAVTPSLQTGGEGAFPQQIGRVSLGKRPSSGERLCSHSHEVPAGHPLYWPERMGEYPDDMDPLCLEHAIEQAVSDNGWCEKCLADEYTPSGGEGETVPGDEWVMVPRVATKAMVAAGSERRNRHPADCWDAMIDASPTQAEPPRRIVHQSPPYPEDGSGPSQCFFGMDMEKSK